MRRKLMLVFVLIGLLAGLVPTAVLAQDGGQVCVRGGGQDTCVPVTLVERGTDGNVYACGFTADGLKLCRRATDAEAATLPNAATATPSAQVTQTATATGGTYDPYAGLFRRNLPDVVAGIAPTEFNGIWTATATAPFVVEERRDISVVWAFLNAYGTSNATSAGTFMDFVALCWVGATPSVWVDGAVLNGRCDDVTLSQPIRTERINGNLATPVATGTATPIVAAPVVTATPTATGSIPPFHLPSNVELVVDNVRFGLSGVQKTGIPEGTYLVTITGMVDLNGRGFNANADGRYTENASRYNAVPEWNGNGAVMVLTADGYALCGTECTVTIGEDGTLTLVLNDLLFSNNVDVGSGFSVTLTRVN